VGFDPCLSGPGATFLAITSVTCWTGSQARRCLGAQTWQWWEIGSGLSSVPSVPHDTVSHPEKSHPMLDVTKASLGHLARQDPISKREK
jgi:hypothetical protein